VQQISLKHLSKLNLDDTDEFCNKVTAVAILFYKNSIPFWQK